MATEPKKIVPARLPEEDHLRREAILEAVGYAAEYFLRSESWKDCIPQALRRIGLAFDVSGVYIFQNHTDPVGLALTSLCFSWRAPGVAFTLHELLLRMTDPAKGLIQPDVFLDIAVKFNLIQQIDHWVLRQAIRLLKEESRAGRRPVLEVNLSAKAFVDFDLLAILEKEMAQVNPGSLVLDITEISTLSEFHHAQNFIGALKKLGCRCALDDFGVGLTSFQHLKHLPLDYLKIDGSLIQNLAHNPVNQHIVQAVSHLTRTLGVQTLAQYVESPETIDLLREYGVDMAQGFEIGKPVPLSSVFPAGPLPKAD